MIVSDIQDFNKKQVKVYINGSFAFVLYKGELRLYGIKKDKELECRQYEEITEKVLPKRCKLRAMNLLMTKSYTEYKMYEKLKAGLYSDAVIRDTISYLKSKRNIMKSYS